MPIEFTATESGFDNGLGGASNAKAAAAYHYILFGKQVDPQHSWNSGIYFEFDNQSHGAVNQVTKVVLSDGSAKFILRAGDTIRVKSGVNEDQWKKFMVGIYDVFGESVEPMA